MPFLVNIVVNPNPVTKALKINVYYLTFPHS